MSSLMIFVPAVLMVALTALAWLTMFIIRIPAIEKAGVDLKTTRTRELDSLLPERPRVASQHLLNLFEMPVIFYTVIAFIYITGFSNNTFVSLAFAFVALRALHTLVTLTYNNVMHRFTTYILSSLVLWGMWVLFALELFKTI